MLLQTAGLSEIKLASGEKVKVQENQFVKIKDQEAFFKFLEDREDDVIIKLKYNFGKMLPKKKKELREFLMKNQYDYDSKDEVNYQTCQKYFRDLLGHEMSDEEKQDGLESGLVITKESIKYFADVFTTFKTKIK